MKRAPRCFAALSTVQLRALLQDEPRLQRAARLSRKAQMEQFLAQDLPLDAFLESFCQSRTRSHICRVQLEKLQELLQKGRADRHPAGPVGRPGAQVSPTVVPFAMPAVPLKRHLPALEKQPAAPCPDTPMGLPLRLVRHVPLLSPRPFCVQQLPRHQKQEPPHR
uniref:VPS37D subunit of ESCRT-I n=1 Tax=Anser brachyrhynchus TaxID=132585 RepID=A0A8B9BMS6_9AVES